MADRAANDGNAVPFSARFISEPAQEFRALSRQGKCNRNPCHVEQTRKTQLFGILTILQFKCRITIGVANSSSVVIGIAEFFASIRMTEWRSKVVNLIHCFSTICTTKLFFSPVAGIDSVTGVVDPGFPPLMDVTATRNSDS